MYVYLFFLTKFYYLLSFFQIGQYLILLFAISVAGKPTPSSSYQYVKFIGKTPNGKPSGTSYYISEGRKSGTRTARSYFFPYELYYGQLADIWANELFLPQNNAFQYGGETHFTPDFSDGLSKYKKLFAIKSKPKTLKHIICNINC